MNKTGGLVWIVLMCMVASCQTQKKPTRRNVYIMNAKREGIVTVDTFGGKAPTVATPAKEKPVTPSPSVNTTEIARQMMPLLQRQPDFKTFAGKAKMHFKGLGQNRQFTANIRIKKDEIIWVNVVLFVPVARIYITPDSIQLINYLQREAMKLPIAEAAKVLPAKVDFYMLQNLLIGNALKTEGRPVSASDQGGTLRLQISTEDLLQEVTFNKADSTMRSLQMRTADNSTEGMIQYGNYEKVSGRQFSTSRAVNLSNAGEPYYLDMNFNNAEFDTEQDFPFSIPKSYTLK